MREGIAAREAKIGTMAYHDGLTGLPNRVLFNDRLEQAIRSAKRGDPPPTILIMDLDRFKEVNDSLGHHVGDLLLQHVARRCGAALSRESDTLARLGGDEFAILLPGSDTAGAQVVARNVLAALEEPTMLEGQRIVAGGSIGIASYPEHGAEASTLLRHADIAMYAAKRAGSGFAVYDPRYNTQTQQRLSLMSELRHAVEHDEFVLYYQPKVDLATGTVEQVEALVRWRHPERGFVPPEQFIPFAEHTGYIKAITQCVVAKALAQLEQWHAAGIALNISVNISARDVGNPELLAVFAEFARTHGHVLASLALEITESGIMSDTARALNMLHSLRGMGMRLSIDDFGTGYSSLSYLKRLPVQEIKIDRSFVIDVAQNRDDAVIVRSTIDLGHNMGLRVVAEGVEDQQTCDLLRSWGCDLAQGYFISRPVPAEELLPWLAAWRTNHAPALAA
jgi:diguanylate cyclase (GGDEF)-like protein